MAYKIKKIALVGPSINSIRNFGYVEITGPKGGDYILDLENTLTMLSETLHRRATDSDIVNIALSKRSLIQLLIKEVSTEDIKTKAKSGIPKKPLIGRSGMVDAIKIGRNLNI